MIGKIKLANNKVESFVIEGVAQPYKQEFLQYGVRADRQ